MACPGDARADGPPSPHRGAPFRGSWLSTWVGDDTRPAGQQTVLKSGWCEGILIMGLTSVIPSRPSGPHLPTASLILILYVGCKHVVHSPSGVERRQDDVRRDRDATVDIIAYGVSDCG